MEYTHHYLSPLGGITLSGDGDALTGLWFDGQKHFAETLSAVHEERFLPVFRDAGLWLDIYFSGKQPNFTPPLRPRGTPFRRAVWDILLTIPYGSTVTYAQTARLMGSASPRAVGGAVGHNPISLIIPCHRVVGSGGDLTGYAGGTDRKARLLEMERSGILRRHKEACFGPERAGSDRGPLANAENVK
ncbi:MAG: methylated-DNA--[Clostridia bacterium]|nr:methylated-DNA--[protein]-cysteine S-methyltransferase [Clostridia bacterium]